MNIEEMIKSSASTVNAVWERGYELGIEHAIGLISIVSKKDERFQADLALLLISELEKLKAK